MINRWLQYIYIYFVISFKSETNRNNLIIAKLLRNYIIIQKPLLFVLNGLKDSKKEYIQ